MGRPILTVGGTVLCAGSCITYIERRAPAEYKRPLLSLIPGCDDVSLTPPPHHGLYALNLWAQIIPSSPTLLLTVNLVKHQRSFWDNGVGWPQPTGSFQHCNYCLWQRTRDIFWQRWGDLDFVLAVRTNFAQKYNQKTQSDIMMQTKLSLPMTLTHYLEGVWNGHIWEESNEVDIF